MQDRYNNQKKSSNSRAVEKEGDDEILEVGSKGVGISAAKVYDLQRLGQVHHQLRGRQQRAIHLHARPVNRPPRVLRHPRDRGHRLLP